MAIAALLLSTWSGFGQTPTAPSATEAIRPAADFATRTFQDPWDMNQRTDLGWFTFGVDQPRSNLTNPTVSNGVFSAVSATDDPIFWLLTTGHPDAAPFGKNGESYPIDGSVYRRLVLRMRLEGPGLPFLMQVFWSNNTWYGGQSTSNAVLVSPGWWIYSVDLPTLGTSAGPSWAGIVDSLRVDPINLAGITITVDWARLVSEDASLSRNITWTGSGPVDIFLDTDADWANGYVGQIAAGATGGSFPFYAGGLPAGTYRVAIRPVGSTGAPAYAPGAWQVDDTPMLTFTSPSPVGSTDDFATTALGNPWDMDTLADLDGVGVQEVTNPVITNIQAEDEAGTSPGSVRVLRGTSTPSVADPQVYFMLPQGRGATHFIDTSRYRILDLEMGVEGARDINLGSIARIIWHVDGDRFENVSEDVVLNHLAGANVLQKIVLDMKTLPQEQGQNLSNTGWTGRVTGFRVDPHEFSDTRTFYIRSVYLRAFERVNTSYNIQWNYSGAGVSGSPSVSLYYDTDNAGYNGTLIATVTNPAAGAYTWNTSGMPAGTYYIYAVISSGAATLNGTYARWPIVIDHTGGGGGGGGTGSGTLTVDRTTVPFGAVAGGGPAQASGPQQVQVRPIAAGMMWTATSSQPWLSVSPASGTGSGRITLSVSNLPAAGAHTATVTLTAATGSPATITVPLTVKAAGATAPPIGVVDTPARGATNLYGAIGVTGWAVDDTEVINISVWRQRIGAEPVHGNGLVYIGEGMFLEGARPDVAAVNPSMPHNTRAGWGMQILTNMLPNSNGQPGLGNGTYTFYVYALDREGKSTLLGSPTVSVNNAASTRPFGTLDTPGNGEEVSGLLTVSGWTLTPQPAIIPPDASTMWVFVDGAPLGHPVYNQFRSDIATLFPGYANAYGGGGSYHLDTTGMADGLHDIAWSVTDNLGRIEGIGSRLFRVRNAVPASDAPQQQLSASAGKSTRKASRRDGGILYRTGWDVNAQLERLAGDTLQVEQGARIELHAPAGFTTVTFNGSEALPVGATFDADAGVFYWHLDDAFLGAYEVAFHDPAVAAPQVVRVSVAR